jgi:type III pantothenate kinase
LLTGGASPRLRGAIRCPGREIPDLVLRGLLVVATST